MLAAARKASAAALAPPPTATYEALETLLELRRGPCRPVRPRPAARRLGERRRDPVELGQFAALYGKTVGWFLRTSDQMAASNEAE